MDLCSIITICKTIKNKFIFPHFSIKEHKITEYRTILKCIFQQYTNNIFIKEMTKLFLIWKNKTETLAYQGLSFKIRGDQNLIEKFHSKWMTFSKVRLMMLE